MQSLMVPMQPAMLSKWKRGDVMSRGVRVVLLLLAVFGGTYCEDQDGAEFKQVTVSELLADAAAFDGRKVEMNVRLGLVGECTGIACPDDNPCCASCTWSVIFGDTNCPLRDGWILGWYGSLLEPGTEKRFFYYGDGCAGKHAPIDLLGPEVEFEVGAKYLVWGTIAVVWSNGAGGVPIGLDLVMESVSKTGPRRSGLVVTP